MKAKKMMVILLIFPLVMLSGCWDKVEIEQRAIVAALMFDKVEVEEGNNKNPMVKNGIEVRFGLVNPAKIQGSEEAFISEEIKGINFPDAAERLSSRISRRPFFGHTRLVVFTEKFIKDDKLFKEVLDDIERRAVINQQMKVVILKGDPDKIMDVKPKLENLNAAYVSGIVENSSISSEVVSLTFAELLKDIRSGEGSLVIPTLEISSANNGDFVIDELTLIKDYKFLKYLDTKYIGSYKIITNKLDKGREFTKFNDIIIPYYIYSVSKKIWMKDEQTLKYKIRYEIEGDISQYEFNKDLFDVELIKNIEKKIGSDMEKELKETTAYFQKEIGHDYLGFDSYTHKYHNKIYKKYKNNWDDAFKSADISYDVKVNVRRIGTSKK